MAYNEETDERQCSKCRKWKTITEYKKNKASKAGRGGWCKSCSKEYKTPDRVRNWDLQYRYDLSLEDYDRMKKEQDNKCVICLKEPIKLVVDHCHASGKVRGLLCIGCNSVLGHAGDSTDFFDRANSYLRRAGMK